MKLTAKFEKPKILILGAAALGYLLRTLLYTTGTDEKGLLIGSHWANIGLWILTAAAAAALFLLTRKLEGCENYEDCYPVSYTGCAGCILLAVEFLVSSLSGLSDIASKLDVLTTALGFASALSLCYIGACRLCRMKPLFLCHAVVSICFALRMVGQYRSWSSDPQLQDYCFTLSSYVGLMLTSYQLAAFDAGMGNHKRLWRLGLATVYLCLVSAAGPGSGLFLPVCGIWVLTNLTHLTARPRRQRPTLDLAEDASEEGA